MVDLPPIRRKKYEHLITELVHQRDVIRALIKQNVTSQRDFTWLYQMRFYWEPTNTNVLKKLVIKIANANFYYGFEYLGVGEKLVQTPLTDRCYLTLTQVPKGFQFSNFFRHSKLDLEEIPSDLPELERQKQSKHSELNLEDLCLFSVVMKDLISKLWVVFLLVFARYFLLKW